MGSMYSNYAASPQQPTKRIWPIRYIEQAISPGEIHAAKFSKWDPKMYMSTLKYPAKEPPKDF